jgi:hypothetical protein
MKAESLLFVFIYFSESGLFNGLQPIQIKKSFPASGAVRNVSNACLVLTLRPGSDSRPLGSNENKYSTDFESGKGIAEESRDALAR